MGRWIVNQSNGCSMERWIVNQSNGCSMERWIVNQSNGCLHRKGGLLPKLRRIARSRTRSDINDAITDFKSSEFWTESEYSKLTEYLSKYWFPIINVSEDEGGIIDEG